MTTTIPAARTSAATTEPAASGPTSRGVSVSYGSATSAVLLAAFTLSAIYTVWTTAVGSASSDFTAWSPAAWLFYLVGFGAAILARRDRRPLPWALTGLLVLLIAVCFLVYPSSFTAEQQNWFGWFENDVYTGLLIVALFLNVAEHRRVRLVP